MKTDISRLIKTAAITTPLMGLYDAPDPSPFAPLVTPGDGIHTCGFAFYRQWLKGNTLHLTAENHGCGGCGYWIFGKQGRSRQEFVEFLVEEEGLKASHYLMNRWLDFYKPYTPMHPHILLGPLQPNQSDYLKSVTFFVNPDQLSLMILAANYHHAPGEILPVIAPFGSGCMQLLPSFKTNKFPQAIIGATDIAMRQYLPPDIVAFTVNKPMFEQLGKVDEKSFLSKQFWKTLQKARKK
jgi:hypothetical protein